MQGVGNPNAPNAPNTSIRSIGIRVLLHLGSLLVAIACFVAYQHFKVAGQTTVSWVCLAAAGAFGFTPLRDMARAVFAVEGKALHLLHALGGAALIGLPVAGAVSGTPVLTAAANAPFAIMGAAQALMHQDHPRNAKQAAALQRFAESLPAVAQFAGTKDITSPENARRAIAVLTDIVAKAQALGETELESDSGFQNALTEVTTRFSAILGLDAVDLVLGRLAANPANANSTARLRTQIAATRQTFKDAGTRGPTLGHPS